ncbi:MAG: hypothetical protein LBP67_05145 [Bacteroidales bacterium]|jgi:very-short-patch-repair endonuclease|nr:hypothetical protein [Bacteroidales bacterium]
MRANRQIRMQPDFDLFKVYARDQGLNVVKEHRFDQIRRWKFDYAITEHKIAIEVEGGIWKYGRHNRASGFLLDMEKYNTAAMQGWLLLRVQPNDLCTQNTINMIKETIKNRN